MGAQVLTLSKAPPIIKHLVNLNNVPWNKLKLVS